MQIFAHFLIINLLLDFVASFIIKTPNCVLILLYLNCIPLGVYDALPEQAFCVVGHMDEEVQRAEKRADELSHPSKQSDER